MTESIPATRFAQVPDLELRFPPLPTTVVEVSRLLSDKVEVPDTFRLVEVVNHDPVVAASVLRRINSAYYGMRRLIADVRKAVFLLGFLEVSNIVLTAGMLRLKESLSSAEQEEIFTQVIRTSVCAAFFSQEMALFASLKSQPTAFSAGLLHSIGRLVLLYNKPHDYEALWWTRDDGFAPSIESETLIFGVDHARLGAQATQKWNLPDAIVEVVSHYNSPEEIQDVDVRLLAVAVAMSVSAAERVCLSGRKAPTGVADEALIAAFAKETGIAPAAVVERLESLRAKTPGLLDAMMQE